MYRPSQDQKEALETDGNRKFDNSRITNKTGGPKTRGTYQNDQSASFISYECNMIIWGKWKNIYDEPIQLNIETDNQDDGTLKSCIVNMIAQQDYCLFVTEDGKLYSMGQSDIGMLGHGKSIVLPDDQRVLQLKAGKSHALVLTNDGKVYGWGLNNYGQVGYLNPEDPSQNQQDMAAQQTSAAQAKLSAIYEPVLVYPTIDMLKEMELANLFDYGRQIEIYEDSSFLVTEDGLLYSWGKNEHGILGREAKLDVKLMAIGDKRKKLTFSTFVPGKVNKLERFNIRRVNVTDGKLMAYFVDNVEEYQEGPVKDSEADSEEEKDVVEDISAQRKEKKNSIAIIPPLQSTSSIKSGGDTADNKSNRQRGNTPDNFSATEGYKKQNTSRSNMSSNSSRMNSKAGGGGGRKRNQDKDQNKYLTEILKKALGIKEDLMKFDRALADSVKPLTDLQDRNIYYQVIDKFAQGKEKMNDAEELRQAIDRVQIAMFRGDDDLFKDMLILVDLLNETLTMKKFNLVGCKMKIYQERMREIKEGDQIDIDKCGGHLHTCKKLCKKIQSSLKKNIEYYLQMHQNCTVPSSLALSALTNSVFTQCDVWNGLNTLSSYTYILQSKIQDTEYTNDKVRVLWGYFQQLQKTDFNKKVELYKKKQKEFPNTKDWFDAIMREIHFEIKNVITNVKYSMKENKGENDILYYCQSLLHDACLVRQLLYSAQQALFEGAINGGNTKGGTPGNIDTQGNLNTKTSGKKLTEDDQLSFTSQQINTQGGGGSSLGGKIGSLFGVFSKK